MDLCLAAEARATTYSILHHRQSAELKREGTPRVPAFSCGMPSSSTHLLMVEGTTPRNAASSFRFTTRPPPGTRSSRLFEFGATFISLWSAHEQCTDPRCFWHREDPRLSGEGGAASLLDFEEDSQNDQQLLWQGEKLSDLRWAAHRHGRHAFRKRRL